MVDELAQQVLSIADPSLCDGATTYQRYLERAQEGNLTRSTNVISHLCVYFLPYNPETQQIFLVHHKKSGLWLSPGGHIEQEETILEALNREIEEELGVPQHFQKLGDPFLLSITPINNPPIQLCREHLDLWYLFSTDGKEFRINPEEFHQTKWVTFSQARELVKDPATLKALQVLETKPT